jgi:hypothetical protein
MDIAGNFINVTLPFLKSRFLKKLSEPLSKIYLQKRLDEDEETKTDFHGDG